MEIKGSVFLKKRKEESVLRFHPWVFSGAIKNIVGEPENGDWINIFDIKNNFLGCGHFQNGNISVRILSFTQIIPDVNFWKSKISSAFECRKNIGLLDFKSTNAFRLVFGEGDGMPGLIIDVYDKTAVIQAHSAGITKDRNIIAEALMEVMKGIINAVYFKGDSSNIAENAYLIGETVVPATVLENSSSFLVNWVDGQKTGFFIDQRDNRNLLMNYSKNKKVLNTFCYTGGFSVFAMKAGAELVHSVDSSKPAIDLTNENIKLNFPDAPDLKYSAK